ncbi:unnamed protein product [Allacma fusca]|uniref:Uncharacterized protein n=1 Tax=Allacma fusca TaxID=39272 RepID=A0A8J2PRH1_9HEXA|nr:unnamed protein product [Allacma fusca]
MESKYFLEGATGNDVPHCYRLDFCSSVLSITAKPISPDNPNFLRGTLKHMMTTACSINDTDMSCEFFTGTPQCVMLRIALRSHLLTILKSTITREKEESSTKIYLLKFGVYDKPCTLLAIA